MPGMFDPSAGMDPLTMLLMGGAAGLGQAGATSRTPISPASVFGGLGAGLMAGQQAANQSQLSQQEAISKAAQNQLLLSQLGMMQGQEAPTGRDVLNGKFRLNPDFAKLFPGMFGGSSAPQLPQPPGVGGALPGMPSASTQPGPAASPSGAMPVANALLKMGYAPHQMAAVMGNAAWESSLNPADTSGDGGTSIGLWQWHAPERKAGLMQYAQQAGQPWTNPLVQAGYMDQELRQRAPEFFNTTNVADATRIFQDKFEIPAKNTAAGRTKLAQNFLPPTGSDAAQGMPAADTGQAQPSPDAAQLDPRLAIAQNLFRRQMLPMTPIEQAQMNAKLYPPGSQERTQLEDYASKLSGVDPLQVTRPGGIGWHRNSTNGKWELEFQNPSVEKGSQITVGPNGQLQNTLIPGAPQATATIAGAQAGGAAGGALPLAEPTARAKAKGEATFQPPVETFGPGGVPAQTPRENLPQVFGQGTQQPPPPAASPPAASPAQNAPLGQADFDRLKAAGVPAATIEAIQQAQGAQKPQLPEAAPAQFQMRTPAGVKPVTQVHVNDMFPGGAGIPQPPPPPAGSGYGPPTTFQTEVQKDDGERIQQYNKEQAAAQKQYQDLLHLREVLNNGFTTGKAAQIGSDFANLAHSFGADWLYPRGWAPANAAEYDKASTDLIFAALKALPGQPRVAEITGLQKANPGLSIPRETNFNMMNDILASNKWQDERARLANEFKTAHPGTPLSVFDSAYNQQAPLVDVTNEYKGIMHQYGAVFPEETAAGGAVAPAPTNKAALPKTATGPNGHKLFLPPGGTQWIDTVTGKPYAAPPSR